MTDFFLIVSADTVSKGNCSCIIFASLHVHSILLSNVSPSMYCFFHCFDICTNYFLLVLKVNTPCVFVNK